MKKYFKYILCFVIGGIICSIISVSATLMYQASQITYTKGNNQEVTLDTALDELYTSANTTILNLESQITEKNATISNLNSQLNAPLDFTMQVESNSTNYGLVNFLNHSLNGWSSKYSKIKYVSATKNDNVSECKLFAVKRTDNSSIEVSEGTVLNSSTYYNIFGRVKSKTNGSYATCKIRVQFYN